MACVFRDYSLTVMNFYVDSEEERYDLKKAYVNHKGDMNRILEFVLFSSPDDEPRFNEVIQKWIDSGEVEAYDKYVNEPKSRKENRKRKVRDMHPIFSISVLETIEPKRAHFTVRKRSQVGCASGEETKREQTGQCGRRFDESYTESTS